MNKAQSIVDLINKLKAQYPQPEFGSCAAVSYLGFEITESMFINFVTEMSTSAGAQLFNEYLMGDKMKLDSANDLAHKQNTKDCCELLCVCVIHKTKDGKYMCSVVNEEDDLFAL